MRYAWRCFTATLGYFNRLPLSRKPVRDDAAACFAICQALGLALVFGGGHVKGDSHRSIVDAELIVKVLQVILDGIL